MESNSQKTTNDSCISTTGTPASQRYSDNMDNVKYINLNFVDNSESSCQAKEVLLEYQRLHNSSQDQSKKSGPIKILPQPLNGVDKRPKSDQIIAMQEKSLLDMGYKANEVDGWENIVQPPKEDLYKLLKNMIDNHIKPSVQIRIGDVTFNCHLMVLQCYSDFFMECNNEILIKLPEEKITPAAFMMVYDWMLSTEPLVQREGILELFNAANFLRIKELINQCWLCLDDDVRFREDTAFLLYLEARNYGLESLEQLMLMRICKFFLTLVASREFLDLTVREVCTLLSSNTIGVNSEIEIFMSVVRWLSHDWSERQQYMLDVVKCVRFSLMPPWFLVTLNKNTECPEIDRIIEHPEVKKMINDGITYTTTQLYYGENREEFLHFLERYQLTAPMQRQWVYDKACNYHHRLECPNMQYVTYKSFSEYLEMIRTIGKDYWRSLEMDKGTEKSLHCCLCTEFRKSGEPNLATVFTKTSRDQGIQCVCAGKNYKRKDVRKSKSNHNNNNSSNKSSIRRIPRGHVRRVTTLQTTNSTNNDDMTTEADETIDFKYPLAAVAVAASSSDVNLNIMHTEIQTQDGNNDEKRQLQTETVLYNDEEQHQTDIKEQQQQQQELLQKQQQQHINDITFNNGNILHKSATILLNNNLTTKWEQNQEEDEEQQQQSYQMKQIEQQQQPQPQQHEHELQQQLQYQNKILTNNDSCCTVIYERAGGLMPDYSDFYNVGGKQQQQQQQQYIIGDNHDIILMKHNVSTAADEDTLVDYKDKGDFTEEFVVKQKSYTNDVTRISNHKILVFGGIDPFSFHSQHAQYHYQQQLQEQQRLLQMKQLQLQYQRQHYHQQQQQLLQHKHVFSSDSGIHVNTALNYTYPLHATNVTDTSNHNHLHQYHCTNANNAPAAADGSVANKTFDNIGDHVLLYDIDAMEWRHLSHIPFGPRHHHAVVVCNDLIYVIGGTKTLLGSSKKSVFEKTVWCFNPQTVKWSLETNLPESRRDFGVVAIDEKILANNKSLKHEEGFYLIGGEGVNGKALNSVWFYNVKRKMWTKKPSLNMGRYGLAAVMVNNEIWVAGGIIDNNTDTICGINNNNTSETLKSTTAHIITDTVEIYNLTPHTHIHDILPKQHHRVGFLYQKYNDDCGGQDEGGKGGDKIEGKIVDAEKSGGVCWNINQWFQVKLHLRIPRLFGKFCKMPNNDLYLVGGIGIRRNELENEFASLSAIDVFNREQHKWEHIGDLTLARHGHDVGRLNDHCIVIIGGVSTHESCCLSHVEAFCTKTRKSLSQLPDLPWPLSGCGVVTMD